MEGSTDKRVVGPTHPMEVHAGREGRDEEGSDAWLLEELVPPDQEEELVRSTNDASFAAHRERHAEPEEAEGTEA